MNNGKRRKMLGNAIRKERERQRISQRRLAQMTGTTSHAYIVEIENGAKGIGFDKLCGGDSMPLRLQDAALDGRADAVQLVEGHGVAIRSLGDFRIGAEQR